MYTSSAQDPTESDSVGGHVIFMQAIKFGFLHVKQVGAFDH